MTRYAVIENNIVANLIKASGPDVLPGVMLMPAHDWTALGDVLESGQLPQAPPEPEPNPEAESLARIEAIKAALAEIDLESIRPLRAIDNGTDTVDDHKKLVELEARAAALRVELEGLYG